MPITKQTPQKQPEFELNTSRQFVAWLTEQNLSLGFSTYQSGKMFLIGHNSTGSLSVFERTFERPMGLWSDGEALWLSTLYQIHRFKNSLPAGDLNDGYDRLFVPQMSYVTADIDVHDVVAANRDALPVFVNTLFSCLATVSADASFKPIWQPPFISQLAPEDRCHLNGLAFKDDQPAYVTAIASTNVTDCWREHRHHAGIVMDVKSNEFIAQGLSIPHSSRWAEKNCGWLILARVNLALWIPTPDTLRRLLSVRAIFAVSVYMVIMRSSVYLNPGIEHSRVYRWMSVWQKKKLKHVAVCTWLT